MVLSGVGDKDIRRKILSTEDILPRSWFKIIYFTESKEFGRNATENFVSTTEKSFL